ncbi:MAG: hypothetical protein HQK91_11615 [Nitrospirae bacterium]|nr:hypothetical protein [Nitrospirota bacterium]
MENYSEIWYEKIGLSKISDKYPHFADIRHINNYDEFMSLFHEDEGVIKNYNEWFKLLKRHSNRCLKFIGKRGSGKSTFLRYLKLRSSKENTGFHVEILYAQDFWKNDSTKTIKNFDEMKLIKSILEAIIQYFLSNSLFNNEREVKEYIDYKDNDLHQLKNSLINIVRIVEKEKSFKKDLILILDNCDLFECHNIEEMVTVWHSMVNILQIYKVVTLRNTTSLLLSKDPNGFFSTEYSSEMKLLQVELIDILKKRFNNVTCNQCNLPFEPKFMKFFGELFNKDYRTSLSRLEYLFNTIPITIAEDSKKVFTKKYAYYLLKNHYLHNFFANSLETYSTEYSIQKEILFILNIRKLVDKIFFLIMENHFGFNKQAICEALNVLIVDDFIYPLDLNNWNKILMNNIESIEDSKNIKVVWKQINFEVKLSSKADAYILLLMKSVSQRDTAETYINAAIDLLPINSKWLPNTKNIDKKNDNYQKTFGKLIGKIDYDEIIKK